MVVRQVILGHEIRDAGGWNRRGEPIGLGDDPVGELSAVAAAFDAHALAVEPAVTLEGGVDTRDDIPGLASVWSAKIASVSFWP